MNNNIRIITLKNISLYSKYKNGFHFVGDSAYIAFQNGNRAKLICRDTEIEVSIINKIGGAVDHNRFPYANYFSAKQCSPDAPKWYPYIDRDNRWYFSQMYKHVHPNSEDYRSLSNGIDEYITLFE